MASVTAFNGQRVTASSHQSTDRTFGLRRVLHDVFQGYDVVNDLAIKPRRLPQRLVELVGVFAGFAPELHRFRIAADCSAQPEVDFCGNKLPESCASYPREVGKGGGG